jgi:hypothetical protein
MITVFCCPSCFQTHQYIMENYLNSLPIPSDNFAGVLWKNTLNKENFRLCSSLRSSISSDDTGVPIFRDQDQFVDDYIIDDTDELYRMAEEQSGFLSHHRVKRSEHVYHSRICFADFR